jgi:hypothetical protein
MSEWVSDDGDETGDLSQPIAGGGKQGAAHGNIPPRSSYLLTKLHGVISQNIVAAVRTSNPTARSISTARAGTCRWSRFKTCIARLTHNRSVCQAILLSTDTEQEGEE